MQANGVCPHSLYRLYPHLATLPAGENKPMRLSDFTTGFSLVLLGKSQRPQWKTNGSFTDKITNDRVTTLYTLQLFSPLLCLSSPFLCNQQQHQGLVTHRGLKRSLQTYCLSSKLEYAAGMPSWLACPPAFTQFTSGMAMTLLWFRWRGNWSEIKHFSLHRTFYYRVLETHQKL